MKVKLTKQSRRCFGLTCGNVYWVIGIEADFLRIMDDDGMPGLFPPRPFQVVDPTPGWLWNFRKGSEGELYAYPPELEKPGFFEAYFDYDLRAWRIVRGYLVFRHKQPKSRKWWEAWVRNVKC